MKLFICIFLSILFFNIQQATAQQSNVTVQVTNGKAAVPFASVQIKSLTDSTNILSKTADSLGKATFNLNYGLYTFKASAVGFKPISRSLNVKISNLAFGISLISNNELKEVKITASKPLMRQQDDKTIVDPEILVAGSASAYEIIEKTPGLFVDQDGNIFLTGATPATIFINGREQKMSASDIASMLKSLPPNSIASIEIMRTPSSRYEASSSGGIVNVVLKKGF
ncbi:MAG TPA: TonB-dependent receptor plug domain-containing protein, partial [Pedobacter sp.]